jgi:hypothetical protein
MATELAKSKGHQEPMYVSKCYPGINYDFQPTSYWSPGADPLGIALRNVKGRKRREMIQDFYENGNLEVLCDELLSDTLDEDARRAWGWSILRSWAANTYQTMLSMKSKLHASD